MLMFVKAWLLSKQQDQLTRDEHRLTQTEKYQQVRTKKYGISRKRLDAGYSPQRFALRDSKNSKALVLYRILRSETAGDLHR